MTRGLAEFTLRGWGTALPEGRLDNVELGRDLGVEPEWIHTRTGIHERRIAGPSECASSLGAAAARVALGRAEFDPATLDLVMLSTYTPDRLLCPSAPKLAHRLGATQAGAFDLNGACSGGVAALVSAASMLAAGAVRTALVVSSDLTSRYVRRDDPKTRLVFGDGAAALLLERPDGARGGGRRVRLLSTVLGSDGAGDDLFCVPRGGTAPMPSDAPDDGHSVMMNGKAIFRFGVERGASVVAQLCERAGIGAQDVRWLVPHQANLRIISTLVEKTAVPTERWVINIERYGNTASASVPIALAELLDRGEVARGDIVLLVAFGAGLTWSGAALQFD